jgi:hypothetical protein
MNKILSILFLVACAASTQGARVSTYQPWTGSANSTSDLLFTERADGGTNARPTVAQVRGSSAISVKDPPYNAAGDGVTTNTTAFRSVSATGGEKFIPSGTYLLGDTIPLVSNTRFVGSKGTILKRLGASTHQTGFVLPAVTNVAFENCEFDGNGAPQFYRWFAMSNGWATDIKFRNCRGYDSVTGMSNTYGSGGDRWFFTMNGAATNWTIENFDLRGPIQVFASWQSADGVTLDGFYTEGAAQNAISLLNAGGTSPRLRDIKIKNGKIVRPAAIGIALGPDSGSGSTDLSYDGVTIENVYIEMSDATSARYGIYGRTSDNGVDGLVIKNVQIVFPDGHANGRGIRLENDLAFTNSTAYFRSPIFESVRVAGGAYGMELENVYAPQVSNVHFETNNVGIRMISKVDRFFVTDSAFTVTGNGISQEYAGDGRIYNSDFFEWGPSQTFNGAIVWNTTSTNDGTYTVRVKGNTFHDNAGRTNILARVINVAGVVPTIHWTDNDETGVEVAFEDNTGTGQPVFWWDNVPVTSANRSVNQIARTNVLNDAIGPQQGDFSAWVNALTNAININNWLGTVNATKIESTIATDAELLIGLAGKEDTISVNFGKLLGRYDGGSGPWQEITLSGDFSLDGSGNLSIVGGSGGNWTAVGTTNSSLAGESRQHSGVFTNGITAGDGSTVATFTTPAGGYVTNAGTTNGWVFSLDTTFNSNAVFAGSIRVPFRTYGVHDHGDYAVNMSTLHGEIDASIIGFHSTPATTNPLDLNVTHQGHLTVIYYGATGEIDLPDALGDYGQTIVIYNTGAFTITIDPNGSEVIVRDGTVQSAGQAMSLSSGAGNYVSMFSDGVRWVTFGYKGTLTGL